MYRQTPSTRLGGADLFSPPARAPRRAATLIECLSCIVCLLVGFAGGAWAFHRFGWLGLALGFVLSIALLWLALWTVLAAATALFEGTLPRCHAGTCKGSFWSVEGDYDTDPNGDGAVYICRCLRQYRRVGRRFMERLPDGSLRPYLVFRPLRGWAPDTEPADADSGADLAPAREGRGRARRAIPSGDAASARPGDTRNVRSSYVVLTEALAALRSRERSIGPFCADALWVQDCTGPGGILDDKSGLGEAYAFRFASHRERWRMEQRGLFSKGLGPRRGNVWGFDKPSDVGDPYRKGLRVVKVATCDGDTISTYDCTSDSTHIRRTANPRLVARRPLREFWLLGAGFRPQSFAELTPTHVLLSPTEYVHEGRPCRVLLTQPFEARRPTPADTHLPALWLCPELGFTPVRVDDILFGTEGAIGSTVVLARALTEARPRVWLPRLTMAYHISYVGEQCPKCDKSEMRAFTSINTALVQDLSDAISGREPLTGTTVHDDVTDRQWVEGGVDAMYRDLQEGFPPMPQELLTPPRKEDWLGWVEE